MGSNPISSGTEVERAGEITWEKEPLGVCWWSPPEDRKALLSERRARCALTGLSSFYKQAPSGSPWAALGSWACWERRLGGSWKSCSKAWRTKKALSFKLLVKGFSLTSKVVSKVGRYSMKKTYFRKVVQVAQLVRAKDWKSLCQWFESTSKRALGPKDR